MKKRLLVLFLAVVMLLQCGCAVAEPEKAEANDVIADKIISSDGDGVEALNVTGESADVSSMDSNKGIVSNTHNEYHDLTDKMIEINKNMYELVDYFDEKYAN